MPKALAMSSIHICCITSAINIGQPILILQRDLIWLVHLHVLLQNTCSLEIYIKIRQINQENYILPLISLHFGLALKSPWLSVLFHEKWSCWNRLSPEMNILVIESLGIQKECQNTWEAMLCVKDPAEYYHFYHCKYRHQKDSHRKKRKMNWFD